MTPNATAAEVAKAAQLGKLAFENGKTRVPAHDKAVLEMIGQTKSDGIEILKAWKSGWDRANLAAPINYEFSLNGQTYRTDAETIEVIRSVMPAAKATGDGSAVAAIMSLGLATGCIVAL